MDSQLLCKYCGSLDDYIIIRRLGSEIAQCKGCGAYIKNMVPTSPIFFFGKYKGIKVKNVLDLSYLQWFLKNVDEIKLHLRTAIRQQIELLTKHDNPMKYYLHDTNALNDEKMTELFLEFGYEGVGLFYAVLEKIGQQEKPIKTAVLKAQLKVGKRLERCWEFMEELGLITSKNGETFNERILSYSNKYEIKRERTRERVARFRANHDEDVPDSDEKNGYDVHRNVIRQVSYGDTTTIVSNKNNENESSEAPEQVGNEKDTENVTGYNRVSNAPKVKESKVNINISFDLFWNEYGKKEGKSEAQKKWYKLTDAEREKIINMLPAYKAKTPNVVYRKHPAAFLAQRIWEDDDYSGAVVAMNLLKAKTMNDNDQIVYENGKVYGASRVEDIEAYKAGKVNISIFDRKIS